MGNFVREVDNIIKKHKINRIYNFTAIILSVAVVIAVVGSLVKPAMSATNLSDSTNKIDDAKMLVGEESTLYQSSSDKSVSGIISKANEDYALGIASQFSVFLNGDFKPKDADTEGRAAIAGSFDPSGYIWGSEGGSGYNVGLGHYVDSSNSVDLSNLGIISGSDYAHAIINGSNVENKLAFKPNRNDALCRKFLVNSSTRLGSYYSGQEWAFYKADNEPVIDFDKAFSLLNQRSKQISQNAVQSENTVTVNGNTVKFTYKGTENTAKSVVFNITESLWNTINSISGDITFEFENIPKLPVSITGKEVDKNNTIQNVTWDNSYIVVNVQTDSNAKFPYQTVNTIVNGKSIGKSATGVNNSFGCNTLLYNFSNAEKVVLGKDFQGSVLAPNADVTDIPENNRCPGHLSGALIAKSFEGYTEFGYRPYTGPIEVLGTNVNYRVNVNKLDEKGNYLQGAKLGLFEVSDGKISDTAVKTWTSKDSTETVTLESAKKYAIKEISAPEGYEISDKIYYFEITEGEKKTATVTVGESTGSTTRTTETQLWEGSENLGNWSGLVQISSDKLSSVNSSDKIRVYLSDIQSDAQVYIQNTSWNNIFSNQNVNSSPVDFTVSDDTLSNVKGGFYIKGQNATVSRVTLISTENSSTTTPQTVETSYISTVNFKEYGDLTFSSPTKTITVNPYNTSYLSQVTYKINEKEIKGNEIDSSYKKVVDECTFVVNNGTILTPIINFAEYKIVNTLIPDEEEGNLDVEKQWKNSSGNLISPPSDGSVNVKVYGTTNPSTVKSVKKAVRALSEVKSSDSWFTIENVLSNYQFFAEGDVNCSGHIVGGIASGGDVVIGSGFQGQISPSVIGGSFTHGDTKPGDWINQDISNASKEIYENSGNSIINFTNAMNALRADSELIKSNGTVIDTSADYITASDGYWGGIQGTKYTIDLTKINTKNMVIPFSVFNSAVVIDFTGVELNDFARNGYKITVSGVNNEYVNICYAAFGSQKPKLSLNGKDFVNDNTLKNLSDSDQGGQINISGMNLVWNFPDATGKITSSYLGGHIVAPNADVEITGGNFEGGIIARTVTTGNEAHFYSYLPYNEIKTYVPGSSESSSDISSSSSSTSSESSSDTQSSSDSSSSSSGGDIPTNGTLIKTLVLNNENNWKETVTGLPVADENGNKYYYYVVEDSLDGYKTTYSNQPVTLEKGGTQVIIITNTQEVYKLPSTGGKGTTVFYFTGGAIAVLAGVMLVIKRRKAFK